MKSFVNFQKGRTPRQAHVDLGDLKDDELGRQGFSGRAAQLYRRNDPTKYRVEGRYRLRNIGGYSLQPPDLASARGLPMCILENDDCRVLVGRRADAMPFYLRNVGGDEAYFIHKGNGRFETEFGPLDYEPGDYVVLPKATTYRIVPESPENFFFIAETTGELQVPDFGILGRHAPFDPTLITVPEPEVLTGDGREEYEILVRHGDETSSLFYPHHPCDVEGWKGDLFPFKLNIRDWNPILCDGIHLPPSVHQFLTADGVLVCHFLPRPAETKPGAERVPYYHRNADYDEVILYHGGTFLGHALPVGLITHSPQGIHHGAPEELREHARRTHAEIDRVDWQMISIDTRRPLRPTAAVLDYEREHASQKATQAR
jgi:homogentisate 1,2-dioxygenase